MSKLHSELYTSFYTTSVEAGVPYSQRILPSHVRTVHRFNPQLPPVSAAFRTGYPHRCPQGSLRMNIRGEEHCVQPAKAKRPSAGTRRTASIHSPAFIKERTSMKSNNGLADAARKHLDLVRRDHERQAAQDRLYVTAAYTYGVEPEEIAASTGLTIERIQAILRGA